MNDDEMKEFEGLNEKQYKEYIFELKVAGVVLLTLILLLAMVYYVGLFKKETDWEKVCGTFDNNSLSYSDYTFLTDTQQVMCTFDNHVPAFVDDDNGGYITNPDYKVCYRFLTKVEGGWLFAGQTC